MPLPENGVSNDLNIENHAKIEKMPQWQKIYKPKLQLNHEKSKKCPLTKEQDMGDLTIKPFHNSVGMNELTSSGFMSGYSGGN